MPRQPLVIEPIAESPLPQPTPYNYLRLRILPPDSSHILMPLFCREFIHISLFDAKIRKTFEISKFPLVYDTISPLFSPIVAYSPLRRNNSKKIHRQSLESAENPLTFASSKVKVTI